jgi:4-amino-4-deoxy-L-arabinose transferase-like glycosyltransferase
MKPKVLLFLIFLLFIFTRFYKINEIPPSVYWDEASIGYNAFSISQTGKDEWGDFLPLHFRAFGEFKLPVFIYATVPFVKIFGLTQFAIRLPAILFSLGVVFMTFLIARKLSRSVTAGLFSGLFITISPWFFIFSRTGYEATAGLMFYLLGIYLFLNYQRKWTILLSIISFILSMYSYNTFRALAPSTIILLLILGCNIKQLFRKHLLEIILAVVLLTLSAIPIYKLYKYDAGGARFQTVGSTFDALLPNYLSHFNPVFFFTKGDINLRSQQKDFGQLIILDILLIPLGLFYLIKRSYLWILIPLILIAPVPAALTKESPHALRSIAIIPFLSILSSFGVLNLKKIVSRKFLIELIIVFISLLLFFNYFASFIKNYPLESSKDWQLGYKSIFTLFSKQFSDYDHIVISNQYAQPYIFGLFYLSYDPNKFDHEVVRDSVDQWGFSTVKSFNKFIFTKISENILPMGKSLIFATSNDRLTKVSYKEVILNLDKSIAFYVYEYKK